MANLFKIAIIVVSVLAVGSNLLAFFLEKFYKKRTLENADKNENK